MLDHSKKRSKLTKLQSVLIAGFFTVLAVVIGSFIELSEERIINIFNREQLTILSINRHNPDYIEIKNNSNNNKNLRGYKFFIGTKQIIINRSVIIPSNSSEKLYFFSDKNDSKYRDFINDNKNENKVSFVGEGYGIKRNENITIYDNKDREIFNGRAD